MRILQTIFTLGLLPVLMVAPVVAQELAGNGDASTELIEAQGELMRLPPLKDLLRIAAQSAPASRQIDIIKQQQREQEKIFRLGGLDILTLQGVLLAGRRDVFSVNSDGTVFVPSASVVDNINTQGSVGIRINPVNFLQSRHRVQMTRLEGERLDNERALIERDIYEGVIHAYNMAQKALDQMDARADALEAVVARADLAERLFKQGAMTLTEYAEFQMKASDAEAKFQDSRGDFKLYYQLLMQRVYGKLP